jgi:annexin A7/11
MEVLGRRSTNQRLEIAAVYKRDHSKELVSELKSDLSGNFEAVITALMIPRVQFYAKELHNAITGLKTDKEAIVDILYTVSNAGIKKIAETYIHLYGKALDVDMKSATKDHFQRLCLALLLGNREETTVGF